MKKLTILLLMIVAVTCYTQLLAQKPAVVGSNEPGWTHIGQTTASFKSENESIHVLGADEFTAIKLKVSEAPIHIERLQVFYESGDMEEINVKANVNKGAETQSFRLKHPDRDISKVAFTYKTTENAEGEKADVELYGLKTNQPQGSDAYREERKEIEQDVERAADEAEREGEELSDEAREEADEAGNEIDREAEEAEREAERKAENTESDLERAADDVGDGVSEGVNDAAAAIKDKKVKDKVGPEGETAYIDDNGKYYYINNEGKKVYISKIQLKDKTDND